MIARRLRALLLAGAAALCIDSATVPAQAQWIVFDPTNFGQNVLTAARELQQVNNEIQMLENQATSLINQARNLASLPYSSLAQLEHSITQTQQLLAQAQRIAYSVSTIDQAFTQQYPLAYSGGTSSQQLLADAQSRWENARAGFQDTMRVQAGVVQNLEFDANPDRRTGNGQPRRHRRAPSRAIRQPARRHPDQAARGPDRGHGLDRARPKPRRCSHTRNPGSGASADAELPQLRRGLSTRQRADVSLMRGRLLNLSAIARAAGFVLVAIAIVATTLHFREAPPLAPSDAVQVLQHRRPALGRTKALPGPRSAGEG